MGKLFWQKATFSICVPHKAAVKVSPPPPSTVHLCCSQVVDHCDINRPTSVPTWHRDISTRSCNINGSYPLLKKEVDNSKGTTYISWFKVDDCGQKRGVKMDFKHAENKSWHFSVHADNCFLRFSTEHLLTVNNDRWSSDRVGGRIWCLVPRSCWLIPWTFSTYDLTRP